MTPPTPRPGWRRCCLRAGGRCWTGSGRRAWANAEVHGVAANVTALDGDVRAADLGGVDAVLVAPARRAGRRRLRAGESEPPLGWCLRLAGRVGRVGIKAAPGLPREVIPPGWELEFVAVGRRPEEAAAWAPAHPTAARRATPPPGGPNPAGRATLRARP